MHLNAMEILTTKCVVPNGNFLGHLIMGGTVGIIANIL